MKKGRVLVTGAGGFVGTNLVKELKSRRYGIMAIDKAPRYHPLERGLLLVFDLNDISSYEDYFNDIDTVYHLAASADIRRSGRDPWWDFNDNLRATINLLEYMRRKDIPEIKFMSTSAVYGVQNGPLTEKTEFKPISLYGASKVACESYIFAYSCHYGFKCTIFRPGQIVGDYQHRGVIVDLFNKLRGDKDNLEVLGNGQQLKSYFHVSDCVKAILSLDNDVYNLANTKSIILKELIAIMLDELKLNPNIKYTGGDRGWPDDTPYYTLSIEKARIKGWEPKYDNEESIRKTVRWLNDFYNYTHKKRQK